MVRLSAEQQFGGKTLPQSSLSFLKRKGSIKVGPGDPTEDMRKARDLMGIIDFEEISQGINIHSAAVDRQGVPFEETPRRLRTRKIPG